jgi:branched-chain amino acid aminotransferase
MSSGSERIAAIPVERVSHSRLQGLDLHRVQFGSVFSDHMLLAEFHEGHWGEPCLRPYGPLPLAPSISAVQYGISVFEGLKAHRSPSGDVLLFRPRENARRINRSAARLAMPPLPESLFLDGLRGLVGLDQDWVPAAGAGALYIRACFFSTDVSIRPRPAEQYAFVIFTLPFSSYYAAPLAVFVTDRYARAFPGGTGDIKPAGNYAPALLAERDAREQGFDSVLWLDARERRYVEECGVMNIFFVVDGRVITPELGGTILAGITRDSVITLLRDMGLEVTERRIPIDEVIQHHLKGSLNECFGTGTAATVTPIQRIHYQEHDLVFPAIEQCVVGPAVRERLLAIMSGRLPDAHGWLEAVG